ncbi:NADH:flavin oxidoreductase/NADH oxidase [Reyranella sp. CPCC 100927]|uniref:NADH:flavin oxidoreductase/NADH oxidase n=1 Tax=Reyranella sp. CPCC 100927 TaxID=2599616 RepID=UPI0011B7860D|nr:NADH:flavin oxidoreductase/NADH oxidase [Reyranella sp. CPCC 100927]TWT11860.1 NADH:flavin oxidoreductase/NADH oxidase [Reyranella sp. CPCC 100927]
MVQPLLFMPLPLRSVVAPNRVVISPMVQYRATDGFANDYHLVHLGKFALGKAGVVFTENVAVEPRGRVTQGDLGLWSDDHIDGLKRVASFIKAEGALAATQITHSGRKGSTPKAFEGAVLNETHAARGWHPWEVVGPTSDPAAPGWLRPRQLTAADIGDLVSRFAVAARRADAAGFDVLEIHGAHGYLLASFLSPVSNTRNDAYGGDRAGRMRFPLEVTRAVRAAWPAHKPLFFRVSSLDGADGWNLDDTVALATELKAAGVDVVDCSSGGLTGAATASPIKRMPGFQVPFAARVRREAGVMSMAVGLILDGPQAEAILQAGDADLIAIGRQALYEPFWAVHAAQALGCDPDFALWNPEYGWWLEKREHTLGRRSS